MRFIFKKIKGDSASSALRRAYAALPAGGKAPLGDVLKMVRKHGHTVVAEVKSYCRPGDHAEIKLTTPYAI